MSYRQEPAYNSHSEPDYLAHNLAYAFFKLLFNIIPIYSYY
jgi:hypothetical protein